MKTVFILSALLAISCSSAPETNKSSPTRKGITKNYEKMLIGPASEASFKEAPYSEWYVPGYDNYKPDPQVISSLTAALKEVKIKVFMGTWCEDSQLQVPRFFKVLNDAGYNLTSVSVVAVDRDKVEPKSSLQGYNIDYVPTFIIFKNNAELGRIVESPDESLEVDLLKILQPPSTD